MEEASQFERETTDVKTYLVSGLLTLGGLAGLLAESYARKRMGPDAWWLGAVQNAIEVVTGVGIIGLVFELSTRRTLVRETVSQLKRLFDEDPAFSESLSLPAKQKIVTKVLKNHLGAELGGAIFCGLVSRYFPESAKLDFRKDAEFDVALSPCTELKINGLLADSPIEAKNYCVLRARYTFRTKFPNRGKVSVICTMSDEIGDLYKMFQRDDCLAREVVLIDPADRGVLVDLFRKAKRKDWPAMIEKIATVSVAMNDDRLTLLSTTFMEETLSFVYEFGTKITSLELDLYSVDIRSIYLKAAGRFPIVLASPTYNPRIKFSYAGTHLTRVASAPFLTSDMPFRPRISAQPEQQNITIETTDSNGRPAWVFPSSGVIFTWQA